MKGGLNEIDQHIYILAKNNQTNRAHSNNNISKEQLIGCQI